MAGDQRPSPFINVCTRIVCSSLPIAMIIMGALYQHECPREHYIPIYLEVMGALYLLYIVVSALPCLSELSRPALILNGLIGLLIFSWFIAGNVWIYSIYEPSYNKTMGPEVPYCDRTIYLFAFWVTNCYYIQIGLYFCVCCCCPRFMPSGMPVRKR